MDNRSHQPEFLFPDNKSQNCLGCLLLFKKVMAAFNSPMDMQELLKTVCTAITSHISVKACQFLIYNSTHMRLENITGYGFCTSFAETFQPDVTHDFLDILKTAGIQQQEITKDIRLGTKAAYDREGFKSLVTIPLCRSIQLVGVLNLYDNKIRVLNQCEIETMKTISEFSANVILAWIFNTTLREVTQVVHSSLDLDEVLTSVVKVVTEKLRVKGTTIRLLDPNQEIFHLKAAFGLSQGYLNKGPVMAKKSISEVLNGQCVLIYDAATDDRLQYPEAAIKEGIGSILSIPLMIYKKIIGDLRIYTHKPHEFSESEINLMMAVGEQCALAIRDAGMYTGIKKKYDDLMSDFHQWFDVNP